MATQAHIPAALAAVHNFIRLHDADKIQDFADILQDLPIVDDFGDLGEGPAMWAERQRATANRNVVAEAMWQDYVQYCNNNT